MKIVIHSKNAHLAEDFTTIVEQKLTSMQRFNVVIERVEVEIVHEQNPRQGKKSHKIVIASYGAGPAFRSESAEFNDLAAFDQAVENFELQIRKLHERSKSYDHETLRKAKIIGA